MRQFFLPRHRAFVAALVAFSATIVGSTVGATHGATPAPSGSDRYLVEFRPGGADHGKAALRAAGAKIVLTLGKHNAAAATIPKDRLDALRRSSGIRFIEPDVPRYMQSEETPYGVTITQADQVTAPDPGNKRICIIDSGYYPGHEDLPSNVTGGDDIGGAGPWDEDGFGHGTHVAGTIAAVDNELGVIGVNPGVNLHIVRVFGDDGGWAYSSTLVAALDRCLAADSDVVSMSLGGAGKSRVEQKAFDAALAGGVLSIAAAGNGGNRQTSYPAGYGSVVSVAAVDSNLVKADFSQFNRDVEIAAPGVAVLSTVPFLSTATLTASGVTWSGSPIDGAAQNSGVTGTLVDGGLCDSAGSWSGLVVLCQRGTISFAEKVANVEAGGGVAAVIYNNVPGGFLGTLGEGVTSAIPAISISQEDGTAALGHLGSAATVVSNVDKPASGYEAWDGTSMATPHVSGIAALVWSCAPTATAAQIRNALHASALDLGAAGRDNSYGYGLVQAKAALDSLTGGTC